MISWTKVTWYSQLFAIVLGVAIFFLGYVIGQSDSDSEVVIQTDTSVVAEVADAWPTLNLPLQYFDYDMLRSGSAGGEYPNWESARFANGYRSFPTTMILFADYSNEAVDLPELPSAAEWQSLTSEDSSFNWLHKEQGESYGDIGKRFSKDLMLISMYESADVTGDGEPEILIATGDMGGNHQPYYYKIIQGDKIIFESGKGSDQLADFYPDESGNGFTIAWRDDKHLTQGLCCALGHYTTRFVYQSGSFTPLYEQEELYYQVENTAYTGE